jgi:hypothetical protein
MAGDGRRMIGSAWPAAAGVSQAQITRVRDPHLVVAHLHDRHDPGWSTPMS